MEHVFSQSDLEAIAKALGDTSEGLTGSEIGNILASLKMTDPDPVLTKWRRLYNAFVTRQNYSQNRRAILEFIRQAMKPARYVKNPERFEARRSNLNLALSFSGLAVDVSGNIISIKKAHTLSEAARRAEELQTNLRTRGVHPDVLRFCRAELVADNYFHAVLEVTKSIADKLRSKTGLSDDGADLVDKALAGNSPLLSINSLTTKSEKSEQSGFANLIKGTFGMFRNPTAHEARILWTMSKEDAEDLLTLASLIHRRLDNARL
ncbi:MAG TPA: TIGR02391 family protein [Blastocatellia bacterium]|nr:TIGR02391 family protein [Blastocatellia bacterium]